MEGTLWERVAHTGKAVVLGHSRALWFESVVAETQKALKRECRPLETEGTSIGSELLKCLDENESLCSLGPCAPRLPSV